MQIKTDTHTHTIASDHAYSTLQENIAHAKQVGLKLMAITDHAPSMPNAPYIWHFDNLKIIPREIDGVKILRGCEANILNIDGDIDLNDKTINFLDLVIASFHEYEKCFMPQTKKIHTKALINVIKSGKINILGHLGNPNYEFDHEEVIKCAIENNVLIEINNSSFAKSRVGSSENCKKILKVCKKLGANIVTSSDAHISYAIGNHDNAIKLIKEVDYPKDKILSLDENKLIEFLIKSGKEQLTEIL